MSVPCIGGNFHCFGTNCLSCQRVNRKRVFRKYDGIASVRLVEVAVEGGDAAHRARLAQACDDDGVADADRARGDLAGQGVADLRRQCLAQQEDQGVLIHRALALLRGRNEGVLRLSLDVDRPDPESVPPPPHPCEGRIAVRFGIRNQGRPADRWLAETARWAWSVKISIHLELELMSELRERAEEEAIRVFARNLKDLLLAAPAGTRATIGLDPGIRTGVKVAVVDPTGKVLATDTVYPFQPKNDLRGAQVALAGLIGKHGVKLIAIGNGTASRESDKLVAELVKKYPALKITKIMVSEAGASVYSASELAAREFPDLDVSIRGAVSIARRLQDPLAELVKIDPKSIGVGQYQHDVSQLKLARSLDAVVEDCVNAVGVDVNTASAALLARISGLNATLAQNIVAHRDQNGAFKTRAELKKVPRLGEKTFEQCAGFLRIADGDEPLDASSVHPEAYPVVERILAKVQKGVRELMGNGWELDAMFVRARLPWVNIKVAQGLYINLDGEPLQAANLRFQARPAALHLHLPAGSPLLSHPG